MITHAYLITANANFYLINKLVELLDFPQNAFYILIDQKVSAAFSDLITYVPQKARLVEVPRIEISWGSYNEFLADLRLLESAVSDGYDYYHLMQGADFPIKKQSEIDAFFAENRGKEFLFFDPSWYAYGSYKLNYHHYFVNNRYYRKHKFLRYISHGIAKTEQILHLKRGKEPIYSGSAMWVISDAFARYLLESSDALKKRCKHTLVCEEVIWHTVIMNSPFKDRIFRFEQDGGNLYFIDWTRREGNSPHLFRLSDYSELMQMPAYYLYARKFSVTKDREIIDKLFQTLKEN